MTAPFPIESEMQRPILDDQMLRIIELVEGSWRNIAATAWEGLLNVGPGYVYLDFALNFDVDAFDYAAVASLPPQFRGDRMWQEVARKCEVYDPETEVVLVFHRYVDDGAITSLLQSTPNGMLPPPEAYAKRVLDTQAGSRPRP